MQIFKNKCEKEFSNIKFYVKLEMHKLLFHMSVELNYGIRVGKSCINKDQEDIRIIIFYDYNYNHMI